MWFTAGVASDESELGRCSGVPVRRRFNAQAIVTNSTDRTEGVELELRWVVNENLLLTAGYSKIEVVNLNTLENGGRFSFLGA